MFWTKKPRIGLDLGSYALKCCVLDSKRQSCSIWSEVLLPNRESREDRLEGEELQSRVQAILKVCEQRSSHWSRHVNLSLEDPGCVGGYLALPPLAPQELQTAIPSAIAKQIPYPLSEVELFNMRVPVLKGKGGTGIFFVAVPRGPMQARVALLTSLGLEVKSAEPALLALIRALVRNHGDLTEPMAVVVAGHSLTSVFVLLQGVPYFARDFRLGGADFTYAFQMAVQVSWQRAEELKHKSDLRQERSYHLEPFLVRWMDEVKRSLDQARKQDEALAVGRLLLTGGTAAFMGLESRLQEHLGLPVSTDAWNRVRHSSIAAEVDDSLVHYDLALGLALHE
ncbi:MAG: hypothetical protein AMXMBFR33_15000 [Candidatus Xenobia bacterium]